MVSPAVKLSAKHNHINRFKIENASWAWEEITRLILMRPTR